LHGRKNDNLLSSNHELVDPAFWRDLQEQFRTVPDSLGKLTGTWISNGWLNQDEHWRISGLEDEVVLGRFNALAERAAIAAGHAGRCSPIKFWLDLLKDYKHARKSSGLCRSGGIGPEEEHQLVEIRDLCYTSAEYCIYLETKAFARRRSIDVCHNIPQLEEVARPSRRTQRGRGRPRDVANQKKIVQIVEEFGPDWQTPENLRKVAERMDAEGIPKDLRWEKTDGVSSWGDKLDLGQSNFRKLIRYRLKQAKHWGIGPISSII
jgi:hypothetical protein